MATIAFVETLGRHGQVIERVRVEALPVLIGRGYTNHVIVDDPFLDPVHARLEHGESGELVLLRLGPADAAQGNQPERYVVDARKGLTVRLGHTRLRVRTLQFETEPTQVDLFARLGVDRWLESRPKLVLLALLGQLGFVVADYLASYRDYSENIEDVSGMLVGLGLWSGMWALGTRLIAHRASGLAHLAVGSAALLCLAVARAVVEYAQFLGGWDLPMLHGIAAMGVLAMAVAAHMIVAGVRSPRRIAVPAGLIFACGLAIGVAERTSDEGKYSGDVEMGVALKPMPAALIPTVTPRELFESSQTLRERVDRELARDP